jgi:hypothetical protein
MPDSWVYAAPKSLKKFLKNPDALKGAGRKVS